MRNQPIRLEPLTNKPRYPAPRDSKLERDGYENLSTADPRTGIRPRIGGTPVWPAYHED